MVLGNVIKNIHFIPNIPKSIRFSPKKAYSIFPSKFSFLYLYIYYLYIFRFYSYLYIIYYLFIYTVYYTIIINLMKKKE